MDHAQAASPRLIPVLLEDPYIVDAPSRARTDAAPKITAKKTRKNGGGFVRAWGRAVIYLLVSALYK